MSHIPTITESSATPEQQTILTAVKKSLGIVPNLVSTLAHPQQKLMPTLPSVVPLQKAY